MNRLYADKSVYRTSAKLMILWGIVFCIWLCISLFTGKSEDVSARVALIITTETAAETVTETFAEETTEIMTSKICIPADTEAYVAGVVAAEMPVYFQPEALKAQAVAARTYACREYFENNKTDIFTDGQAYLSESELKNRWGADFETNYSKIKQAVGETAGEILVYEDEPILAAFCSANGGMSESSGDAWGRELPYLTNVSSAYDEQAPVYTQTLDISISRLSALLGVNDASDISVTKRSAAGYALSVEAGGRTFTGEEVRKALGLRSRDFTAEVKDNTANITVHGYGHGVGMSQYGAEYMAQNGCDHMQILEHYYKGTHLEVCTEMTDK